MIERIGFFREKALSVGMGEFLGMRKLSPTGQDYFKRLVIPAMISGDKRWPSWDARGLLEGFSIEVSGSEKVPQDNLGLVVINHCGTGPLRGWWPEYWLDLVSSEITGINVRWILQDGLEARVFKRNLGIEVPYMSQMQRIFIATYQLFSVPASFRNGNTNKPPIEMIRAFTKGNILGLAPDYKGAPQVANPLAGALVKGLSRIRPDCLVLPVRASSREKDLFLDIGKPNKLRDVIVGNDQDTANGLVEEINELNSIE